MPFLLWDASGLVKRYSQEAGTSTVNALFSETPLSNMAMTSWGYLETYAILRRRYNGGMIDEQSFVSAMTSLQEEVIDSGDFGLISISDRMIFSASSLIDRHNLNSSDAAILASYLNFQSRLPAGRPPCLLVASDKRLLRAAFAEGMQTLDPESLLPGEVAAFLAAL